MITLAIDPGSAGKGSAFAVFDDDRLRGVFFAKPAQLTRRDSLRGVSRIVVEKPQADDRSENVNPRSLIALSWDGGQALGIARALAIMARVSEVTPGRWKGSESKPLQHRRLWGLLTAGEQVALGGTATWIAITQACERGALSRWGKPGAAYYGKNDIHNLLDAAALGAWAVGRLK